MTPPVPGAILTSSSLNIWNLLFAAFCWDIAESLNMFQPSTLTQWNIVWVKIEIYDCVVVMSFSNLTQSHCKQCGSYSFFTIYPAVWLLIKGAIVCVFSAATLRHRHSVRQIPNSKCSKILLCKLSSATAYHIFSFHVILFCSVIDPIAQSIGTFQLLWHLGPVRWYELCCCYSNSSIAIAWYTCE